MLKNSNFSIRVAKFGGTSVADFSSMNQSANIILANPEVRLVILSASAGVTNMLIALTREKKIEKRAYYLAKIRQVQLNIINHLTERKIILKKINQIINSISMLSETENLSTSLALKDELVSYGELMSTLIFVEVLRQRGVSSKWFDVRKIMCTNDQFGLAEPDKGLIKIKTRSLLLPLLDKELVITQGFIGSESKGRTTTLGRGGSDYTTTLLAEALEATRIDIWTDIPGIHTTDPVVVPQAKRIDAISFEEAAEMAIFGARILHPATLLPAMRSGIPVFVGSSKNPAAGGTLVYNYTNSAPLFRALVSRRSQTLLTLHSLHMLHARGFLAKVFSILAKHNISVDLITTSEVSIAITIDTNNFTSSSIIDGSINVITQRLLEELSSLCQVKVEENLAFVAIIGNKLSEACQTGKKIFGILDQFNIRLICYGASNHNLCLLIQDSDTNQVLKMLHNSLFD